MKLPQASEGNCDNTTLEMSSNITSQDCNSAAAEFALKLFSRSVLKQAKLKNILDCLGPVAGQRCLDLGSDNGVISFYLRQRGGRWGSGDMTEEVVEAISSLVGSDVKLVSGNNLPFSEQEFDKIVVVDMLEHVLDEASFIAELRRILKPGGLLVVNTPNLKPASPLRAFRHLIGQTDEKHGHLRAGYSAAGLEKLFKDSFEMTSTRTYSGFFSESIDTAIVFAYGLLKSFKSKGAEKSQTNDSTVSKGLVVTEAGLKTFEKQFKIYSAIYPVVSAVSKLDLLFSFIPGFMRIATFKKN